MTMNPPITTPHPPTTVRQDYMPVPEVRPQQLVLDGFPIDAGSSFSLVRTSRFYTPRPLAYNDHVRFSGAGRVIGAHVREMEYDTESGEGHLGLIYRISVLDVSLDPRCSTCGHAL